MKICNWKPKKQNLLDNFFELDEPFFAPLLPLSSSFSNLAEQSFYPQIDISEDKSNYIVKADLPGVEKKHIQLEISGSVLTLKGERKSEEKREEKGFRRIERSFGSFQRSFDLGQPIDQSKVKAKYDNGVLQVTIPKSEGSQSLAVDIE